MEDIIAIRNGCVDSFEQAYHIWHAKLYTFILKKCRSEDLAEEVVQQTFVRLWEKRHLLSTEYTLAIQLFRVARTILIDELRKAAHARKYREQQVELHISPGAEQQLYHQETLTRIHAAIDQMPAVRKKVFTMSRFQHFTYAQIAAKLAISPKTVENHIALALKYLKKSLLLLVSYWFPFM
ncbi:sigma-70 family RNA polymerase sigma factor [Parapedobacter tibetensis]|uniref:sigma-70 family RNA polymerase sigma factor n=1 Tax=Parapedobacter tibetensis TaxID=2972951 RepID=UPI00214DB682|nr:sigma-70 family RNA polymerase sigma factor [Parapedobacter tibetensis]